MEKVYLSAREAAAELNVARATLYAYVSRGLVRSEPGENGRARRYAAADVRALRLRKSPDAGATNHRGDDVLNFGAPVLASAITLIHDGKLFYRGRDATALAQTARFEQVANLLWQMHEGDPFAEPPAGEHQYFSDLPPLPAAIATLAAAGETDMRAYIQRKSAVARVGADIIRLIAQAYAPPASVEQFQALSRTMDLHQALARVWRADDKATEAIRAALILCADHELNTSAFTVRCAASTGATPYAAVIAGLCALQGPRHGGVTAQVTALFDEIDQHGDAAETIAGRLKRGERLPGFGHQLYPDGDCRAACLLHITANAFSETPTFAKADATLRAVWDMVELKPNIDFALATLARAGGLPKQAPFALFAIGRSAGWIAHIQEQYAARKLIRPRARYTGEEPQEAHPNRAGN